jgi:hypothetical protein
MAWGLLRIHVIVLIPVVLSYHLRTSAILADFCLTFDSTTPPRKLGRRAMVFHEARRIERTARSVARESDFLMRLEPAGVHLQWRGNEDRARFR